MVQYIDKSTIVAEIERLINSHKPLKTLDPTYCEGLDDSLDDILSFIDTLEVKEVDLEKEVEDWVKTGPHTSYPWCTIPDAIRITAEHFFELGLKTKGE